MATDSVIGQHRVKKIIGSAIDRNRLAHAYLFHGPAGVGKDAMVIRLAMGLNCAEKQSWGCGQCPSCLQTTRLEHPGFRLVMPIPSRPKSMNQDKYQDLVREKNLSGSKIPIMKYHSRLPLPHCRLSVSNRSVH